MEKHIKIVGLLNIVFGCIGILGGIIAFFALSGVGAFAAIASQDEGGIMAFGILGIIGISAMAVSVLFSLPAMIAGIGLLYFKNWARIIAVILALLNIFNFPLGTALSVYTLWVLLKDESKELFHTEFKPTLS